MSSQTWWLGRGAMLLSVALALWIGFLLFGDPRSPIRARVERHRAGLDHELRFLRLGPWGARILFSQLGALVIVVALALGSGSWLVLLAAPVIAVAPGILVSVAVDQRVALLLTQVEPWLVAIAGALRASPSLGEAIASTIPLMRSPLSEEIDYLIKEYELGTPLDRALDSFAARIDSSLLTGTVMALKVARRSGGDLPEMLESAASALRELARLEGVVRSKTAEGKAQAFVIGVIPIPMVFGLNAIDPRFFAPLLETLLGNLLIGCAVLAWVLAVLLARKILAVDV